MLTHTLVAHAGQPMSPHDLWTSWSVRPVVFIVALVAVLYGRGVRRPDTPARRRRFWAGLATVAVAVASPLDSAASMVASAHMVQHLLLLVVAAPLLASAGPSAAIQRGLPRSWRRHATRLPYRRRLSALAHRTRRQPVVVGLVFAATAWLWHARDPYQLALRSEAVHAAEHISLLGVGLLVWSLVRDAGRGRVDVGPTIGLLFVLGLQTTLLAALMVFSPQPWYPAYADTVGEWRLTLLGDQQLAGLLMWFPTGFVHLGATLWLLTRWLANADAAPLVATDVRRESR